jgi:predicted flap endonuclease-1-like 5' DNA nuclease
MAERQTERQSTIGDGVFYALMSFVLVGAIGLGMGFAYAEFQGAGWNGGVMVAAIVAGIAGSILSIFTIGKPLPPPNTVRIDVPAAPTVARSRHEPPPVTAHDVGVVVGSTIAAAKERVQSAVDSVSEATGVGQSTEQEPEAQSVGTKPETLAAPREGGPDDLKRIKGVGPKLEEMLHGLGFYHFDQIANWTPEEIAWVDSNLEGFNGRATRDDWVGQAKLLAGGGETDFSKRVDDGEVY